MDYTFIRVIQCNFCLAAKVATFQESEDEAFANLPHYRYCPKYGETPTLFVKKNSCDGKGK